MWRLLASKLCHQLIDWPHLLKKCGMLHMPTKRPHFCISCKTQVSKGPCFTQNTGLEGPASNTDEAAQVDRAPQCQSHDRMRQVSDCQNRHVRAYMSECRCVKANSHKKVSRGVAHIMHKMAYIKSKLSTSRMVRVMHKMARVKSKPPVSSINRLWLADLKLYYLAILEDSSNKFEILFFSINILLLLLLKKTTCMPKRTTRKKEIELENGGHPHLLPHKGAAFWSQRLRLWSISLPPFFVSCQEPEI